MFDIDQLAELPPTELDARLTECRARLDAAFTNAHNECRDLTADEAEQTAADRDAITALAAARALRQGNEQRSALVGRAISEAPRVETRGAMAEFTEALIRGVPYRVAIECRSITSANAGSRAAVAIEAIGRPRWLWQDASIPFFAADSLTVSGPKFAALVAQSATAEAGAKPNMADPSLEQETLQAFAVVDEVSDQMVRFGLGAQAVSERLAAESVFSVNAAFAEALETAAGAPVTFTTAASHMADLGIARVWAQTGAKPTVLLVNSADYPLLSDKAAVGPGDTIGAPVMMFNGVPLVVNDAVTAGVGVALNGRAFSAHGTDVLLASLPDLSTNMVTLRAETYAALLQHDAGACVAVDLAA